MKTKIIALCSALALIAGITVQYGVLPKKTVIAEDKKPTKAENARVQALTDAGIMQGFDDGGLHLEQTVTRAQFAKMLALAAEKCGIAMAKDEKENFADVPKSHWAYGYVSKMAAAGIIGGFPDGLFHPDELVTYEQAAKMAVTLFNLRLYDESYPVGYVAAVIGEGLNDGVSALIGESLTRSDAAAIIANAMDYENSDVDLDGYHSGGGGGFAAKLMQSVQTNAAPVAESEAMDNISFSATASGVMPLPAPVPNVPPDRNTESYTAEDENIFKDALTSPLSTFSIDTDTASYSNLRRFIVEGQKIPSGSVRTEELINYFDYNHPLPTDGTPFAVTTEAAVCPWNKNNLLVMAAVQGDELKERKPSSITFLVDISGSMYSKNKLPLVKRSMDILLEKLEPTDTVSIVTYANGTGIVLDGEKAENKDKIKAALDSLRAGGGTSGEAGLNLAYEVAERNKIDGNNRIILCTDGDFNIGRSSDADMETLITEKREKGIFISVLGFGMGNYKDSKMETIADKGNGNYAYIDNIREAKKVLADDMTKTLFTIAKDVKIQVEFNPEKVEKYRLIGYENRRLNNEDFDNDKKDAGELGAGATVTALYEIVPAKGARESGLEFSKTVTTGSDALMKVKLRYKDPDGTESKLIEKTVPYAVAEMSENMRFAASVAQLGMILNNSEFKGTSTLDSVYEDAKASLGADEFGLRREFLQMVDLLKYKKTYEKAEYSEDTDFGKPSDYSVGEPNWTDAQ